MKKIVLLLLLISFFKISAICNRADKQHIDPNVFRCVYSQEDIYRCFSKKLHCYEMAERCKECFYCGCPIAEHTKKEATQKCRRTYSSKQPIKRDLRKKK